MRVENNDSVFARRPILRMRLGPLLIFTTSCALLLTIITQYQRINALQLEVGSLRANLETYQEWLDCLDTFGPNHPRTVDLRKNLTFSKALSDQVDAKEYDTPSVATEARTNSIQVLNRLHGSAKPKFAP